MATKRPAVTDDHEEKETLSLVVYVPGHEPRGSATPLFHRSRLQLIDRERGRCWVSGMTAKELNAPLEAHHYPVERCFATAWDWPRFAKDCQAGQWGQYAQAFDWVAFFKDCKTVVREDTGLPYVEVADPYLFVDNMLVNGRLLAKQYHIGKNEGVHGTTEPFIYAQKYLAEGYRFSDFEIIHHDQEEIMTSTTLPVPVPTPAPLPIPDSAVGGSALTAGVGGDGGVGGGGGHGGYGGGGGGNSVSGAGVNGGEGPVKE